MRAFLIALGLFFVLMAFLVWADDRERAERIAANQTRAAVATERPAFDLDNFASAVERRLAMRPDWARIEGADQRGDTFRLRLIYGAAPSNHAEIERDAKTVLRAALSQLQAMGRRPASEGLFVSVWAAMPTRGATGKDMITLFGSATYDHWSDSISYRPMG